MALVTKTLIDLLAGHLQRHGTVVWYDPAGDYTAVARALSPDDVAGAAVFRYEPTRGFLALRRALEPHWNEANRPPRLILYVPLEQAAGRHALIEFEVAGVVLQPAQQPPEHDTALTTIARQALAQVFPAAKVEELVAQAGQGQLTLAELDALAEKGLEGQSGVIVTLFGTGNAPDVALRFLADPALDADVTARNAGRTLATLLSQTLGVDFTADNGLPALRNHLARVVLTTDFITALGPDTPPSLRTLPPADSPSAQEAAVQLAQQWRNRLDGAESYRRLSRQVEHDVNPAAGNIPLDGLARTETFRSAEIRLQTAVEQALRHKPTAPLVDDLAEKRLSGFWSNQDPLVKTRWEVIVAAGRVLLRANRIDAALKGKPWPAETLVARYAYGETGEEPWCLLDTAQRHLERDFNRFELDPHQHETLQQLVSQARQRYAATAGVLADRFLRAYADARFESGALLPQTDIYHQTLAANKTARVAYVLVDALRYEMALELRDILESEWPVELIPALATPPTITEIGMAALMPGAEKGITITADKGKPTPLIDGKPLVTRQDRVTYFEGLAGGKSVTAKLEQLAPLTDTKLTNRLKAADLILVTATEEIDGLCENNPTLARRMIDDVLNQLRRGIKTLFGLGFNRVVITADHGYLFGDEISTGQTIDPPGGETVALKRRVWIGKGGSDIPGTLRRPLSAFGIGGDLELVTPYELGIFKVPGGATSYFHGGLSLPELVIPVLSVRSGSAQPEEAGADIIWDLALGSPAITTRFMSVTIEGHTPGLLPLDPPVVSIEVRAGTETISVPISAGYGFRIATKDVALKTAEDDPRRIATNTVTLQITDEPDTATVTVHLLDASTGVSLKQIDNVPLDIAF